MSAPSYSRLISLATLLLASAMCASQDTRYFKAECLTSAEYVRLGSDGRYTVLWREHVGVLIRDEGQWKQSGDVISFKSSNPKQKPYEGIQVVYKGKTFVAWTSEDAVGIVIPPESTKKEIDDDAKSLPLYVYFQTDRQTYDNETNKTYPFHFIKKTR